MDQEAGESTSSLGVMTGDGKRKYGAMNNDLGESAVSKLSKVAKTSSDGPLNEAILPIPLSASSLRSNDLRSHPQYAISLTSMKSIQFHLADLTLKNAAIKQTMQEMREGVVNELLAHMKVRQIAIGQIGRPGLEDDMRDLCMAVLENRKNYMCEKEKEIVKLENLLGGHDAMLELASKACVELDATIKSRMELLERKGEWESLTLALPHMTRLAKFTTAREGADSSNKAKEFFQRPHTEGSQLSTSEGDFTRFLNLPSEIRLQIWACSLPGPRLLAPGSPNNLYHSQLQVCQESRQVALEHYRRILTPTKSFPLGRTPVLYTSVHADIIVRNLSIRDTPASSFFKLPNDEFIISSHHMLSGLSEIRHLALGYDILRENGGTLFRPIQVCCPKLKTLMLFPNKQLPSHPLPEGHLKIINLDSNLLDFIAFSRDLLPDRNLKQKALRGLAVTYVLASHALQYKKVFPDYVDAHGGDWKPIIRVCLLAQFDSALKQWSIRSLKKLGDRSSRGFLGMKGKNCKGFVESFSVADASGELYSRYDGVASLFSQARRSSIT